MKRLVCVVTCLALGWLVACTEEEVIPAATVNGTEIAQQEVVDYLEAIESNEEYVAAIEGSGASISGSSPGSYDLAFAANVLSQHIVELLIRQELEAREIELSDECQAAGEEDLLATAGAGDVERGEELFAGFPAEFREQRARANAEALALQAELIGFECRAEDAPERYFAEHQDEFQLSCVQVITVATEEEATDVSEDLADGADFAAVATERSIDSWAPGGGNAGCLSPSALASNFPNLVSAAVNQVVGPFASPGGFSLARVNGQRAATELEEVAPEVQQRLAQLADESFSEWLLEAAGEADIEIDSRYGRWDPAEARIVAPEVPPTTAPADGSTETTPPPGG